MKTRRVPNTVSKRFRRKLRRSSDPYLLWLRCKRPAVWARLQRYQWRRLWDTILTITPWETPFFASAPRVSTQALMHTWVYDTLIPVFPQLELFDA